MLSERSRTSNTSWCLINLTHRDKQAAALLPCSRLKLERPARMCASLARLQGLEFDSGNWDTRIYDQDLPSQKHFSMHAKWPGISQDMCCDHMCIFFIIIIKVPFSKLHKQYHTAMELCAEVQPWKVIHAAIPQNFSDAAVLSKHCYMPIWQLIVQECHNLSGIVKSVKSRSENWAFNKWPNLTCSSLFNRHSTVHKTEPNIVANAKKKTS